MVRIPKSPLFLVLALLVVSATVLYFIYDPYEGFSSTDCKGVNCPEGQFCQANTCHPLLPSS